MRSPHVIYAGRTYEVQWYYDRDGDMPGYEFYQTLSENDKARFMVLVQHLANSQRGTFLPKIHYNIEDSEHGIYAIKAHAERFLNFMTSGSKVIVMNGFSKQSQKVRQKEREEVHKAIRLKNDYELRIKRGEYYEKQ